MALNDRDKRSYQNGASNFSTPTTPPILHPKDDYPIYSGGEVVGFIKLCGDSMPGSIEIRDKVYTIQKQERVPRGTPNADSDNNPIRRYAE